MLLAERAQYNRRYESHRTYSGCRTSNRHPPVVLARFDPSDKVMALSVCSYSKADSIMDAQKKKRGGVLGLAKKIDKLSLEKIF